MTAIAQPGNFFEFEGELWTPGTTDGVDVGEAIVEVVDCVVVLREISKKNEQFSAI